MSSPAAFEVWAKTISWSDLLKTQFSWLNTDCFQAKAAQSPLLPAPPYQAPPALCLTPFETTSGNQGAHQMYAGWFLIVQKVACQSFPN